MFYLNPGQRWSHTNLTWSLRRFPSQAAAQQLGREVVRRELGHALQVWASHTQLSFVELFDSDRADIQIFFHANYHGDGKGKSGVRLRRILEGWGVA